MHVVTVIPIARGAFKDHLSFFSKRHIEPGVVVDVTIRNKKTPALVLSSVDAREEKSAIRNEKFALKKLEPKVKRRIFLKETIEALQEVARYHGVSYGRTIAHFSPSAIMTAETAVAEAIAESSEKNLAADCVALQAEYDERLSTYRNTTREVFAKGESVVIVAPTVPEAEKLYKDLSRGIEDQTILLTNILTKKQVLQQWNQAVKDPEPLLIIMTYQFLTLPRGSVTTFFLERESARSYVSHHGIPFDTRLFAEELAAKRGSRIVFADFPLRIETHARLAMHDLDEFGRLQRTVRSGAAARIVDARTATPEKKTTNQKIFSPFTAQVHGLLEKELARGSRTFLYASRRGIAPLTICNNCDTPVTDPATGAPMTLHKAGGEHVFVSFRSGAILPSHTPCRNCGGWDLVSLGIGAERVVDEVKKTFPNAPLFVLTAETANTHAKARKIAEQFFSTKGAVLVGTDRALPYLYEPVEHTVVTSVDSALSSSAWRAHTHTLHTLFYLQSNTSESMYVQTRLPDAPVIRAFASGNPTDFLNQELKDRKNYGYPPFVVFVGLSWHGSERAVTKISEEIAKKLEEWEVVGPLPVRQESKNRFVGKAVIRLEPHDWPNERLRNILSSFGPAVSVTIDPDEIV